MYLNYKIEIFSFYKKFLNKFIKFWNKFIKKFLLKDFNIKLINVTTKYKKFTSIKSPHIYNKSKEQFETKTYKSIIYIVYKNVKDLRKRENKFLNYFKYINLGKKSKFLPIKIKIFKTIII